MLLAIHSISCRPSKRSGYTTIWLKVCCSVISLLVWCSIQGLILIKIVAQCFYVLVSDIWKTTNLDPTRVRILVSLTVPTPISGITVRSHFHYDSEHAFWSLKSHYRYVLATLNPSFLQWPCNEACDQIRNFHVLPSSKMARYCLSLICDHGRPIRTNIAITSLND